MDSTTGEKFSSLTVAKQNASIHADTVFQLSSVTMCFLGPFSANETVNAFVSSGVQERFVRSVCGLDGEDAQCRVGEALSLDHDPSPRMQRMEVRHVHH